mgnify:CR=1 FL=1
MCCRKVLSIAAMLAIGILAAPASATTLETWHMTDQELYEFLPDVVFVAEGRIGALGGPRTFELDLGETTAAPHVQADFPWQNGVTESFSLDYSNVSGMADFTVGDTTLSYSPTIPFSLIFIRTAAYKDGSSVLLEDLVLDGVAVGDVSHAVSGTQTKDILAISGAELTDGFSLTGDVTMSWGAIVPQNSQLAFQIKVDDPAPIPEPGTMALLAAGIAGLCTGAIRRRRAG